MSEAENNKEDVSREAIPEITEKSEEIKESQLIEPAQLEPESEITELIPEKTKTQEFIEFFRDLIVILIIVMIIRTYLVAPFQIAWSSMETSYHDKEFILVNKFSYANVFKLAVGDPIRWDVVIFRPHASNWKEYYIKRVIWIAWDTVKFKDWEVYVKKSWSDKFIKLNEDYLSPVNKWKTFLPFDVKETEFTVPQWEYFLMWDNRSNSSDSRSCFMSCSIAWSTHFIKRYDIIWRVFLDFWYFNIFRSNDYSWEFEWLGKLKWESKPRFFNTPKTWEYKELN
ncbi:MAG: Signal peptidase I [uncultured bacterium (gcode 4)]|uniref:Signal peptidase I n=1 Tax=uncultured bacterium (gcode 4) TaxID=1234023 RepID=K2GBL1_9BACT|nr:MAG: Signal peptidase I [uncultured bacterium (gcode 4)]